jgi:hypothetical protein
MEVRHGALNARKSESITESCNLVEPGSNIGQITGYPYWVHSQFSSLYLGKFDAVKSLIAVEAASLNDPRIKKIRRSRRHCTTFRYDFCRILTMMC